MTRPGAVLFDLDDTFYPYLPCHEAGVRGAWDAAQNRGLAMDETAFAAAYARHRKMVHARLGDSASSHNRLLYFQGLAEEAARPADLGLALALYHGYWQAYLAAMARRLDPAAHSLLGVLREWGVPTALVTDMTAELQFEKLAALGLARAFDAVVTSEEAGADKPDPRMAALALRKLGVAGADCLMVGDSPAKDGGAARGAGAAFCWINRSGAAHPADLPEPDAVFADLGGLMRWLGERHGA